MLNREYELDCSIARSLEVVGERWTLLIVRDILLGERRFGEIQSSLGVARNVLSDRLQRLEREGILERHQYSERPPRDEYFLTEKGLDLWPTLVTLLNWGNRHSGGAAGPPMRIVHKGCGGDVNKRQICERCGAELEVRDAAAAPGARAEALAG